MVYINNIKTHRKKHKINSKKYNKKNIKTKKRNKYIKKLKGGNVDYDTMFLNCFDANLQKVQNAIRLYSGKHSIDRSIAQRFIDRQISDVRKQAARDLIDNTVYITLEEVSSIIEQLVIKLYNENNLNSAEQIYIFSGKPEKSFYFISILVLYYIRKNSFKEPTHFIKNLSKQVINEIGDNPLLIFDDVSYSGSQLSTMLNNIYYDTVIINKKTAPNIYISLVGLNDISKNKLSKVPTRKLRNMILDYTESPFKLLYLQERLYEPLLLKIGIERYFYLNVFFSPYTNGTPYISLYLDHKIADEASTYTNVLLYGTIVPSNYDYSDYIIVNDYLVSIIDEKQLESSKISQLLTDFNTSNNTNFTDLSNYEIIVYLYKKLKRIDTFERNITYNSFEPFINGCNQNSRLLENISDPEIINFNYSLFIVPKDCFEKSNECVVSGIELENYLDNYFTTSTISKEDAIRISNKINSIKCPISWYKSGEFQMSCINPIPD